MTPEQRVTAAIDCTPYAKATPDAYADAALDAVRDALTSDDPEVVRAMAERVGLVDLHPGESVMWRAAGRTSDGAWSSARHPPGRKENRPIPRR